jgi:DNA repair protein RecN (Recombination protein N)
LLRKLTIQNYALVDRIDIEFGPGLTVLTGETGAGKSVIIAGLLLAMGGPADKEYIRHGSVKASAEAQFDPPSLKLKTKTTGSSSRQNAMLHLSREVSASGSSRAYINGHPENLATVREVSASLADFHSQQGQRNLLDIEKHRELLDSFAGLTDRAEKLAGWYQEFTALEKQLNEAQNNAEAMRQKLELVNFQIDELTKASLRVGEEADLDAERKRLESVRFLMETGQNALAAISESDNSIISSLSQIDKELRKAAGIDNQLNEEAETLSGIVSNLNDLTRNLEGYLSRLEDNPTRLEEINSRLAELYRLRKKYGANETELLAKLEELKGQSLGAADYETLIKSLKDKLALTKATYFSEACEISRKRKAEASRLEKAVEKHLADLALEKAIFKIDFQSEIDENGFEVNGEKLKPLPYGFENIEFLIATNPNEPIRPMVKIASGGEISRIMLALLSVIAGKYKLPTIIFDEIDTGIGGQTALKLAEKLKELALKHQVLVISHLPSVAAAADHHLAVSKATKSGRNIITVKEVSGKELKAELSRMSGKSTN